MTYIKTDNVLNDFFQTISTGMPYIKTGNILKDFSKYNYRNALYKNRECFKGFFKI
jgi:hypothetical protein